MFMKYVSDCRAETLLIRSMSRAGATNQEIRAAIIARGGPGARRLEKLARRRDDPRR